jgi:hypothetical protein
MRRHLRPVIAALCLTCVPSLALADVFPTLLVAAKAKKTKKTKKKKKTKDKDAAAPAMPALEAVAPESTATSMPASVAASAPAGAEDEGEEESGEDDEVEEGLGKKYVEPKDEQSRAPKLHWFVFGARLRGGPAFGSIMNLGLNAGVSVGARLPFLRQAIHVALVPSFGFVYAVKSAGQPDAMSLGLLLPLEISGRIELGPGHLRVAAGPTLFVGRTVGRSVMENVLSFGAEASVGYLFRNGKPLRVGPEVGYRLLPLDVDNTRRYVHIVEVGARIELDREE